MPQRPIRVIDWRASKASPGPSQALRRDLLVAFALPTVILGVMHGPEGLIQGIYAKHAGLSLSALAVAMLLTKMFDALTYPMIGYLSDRTFARTGTRRIWLIAGSLISVIGVWFLLRPQPDASVVYFGVWMSVTYLGWKAIEIPLQAWSYGLSADYAQRARVQGWRGMAQMAGQLLFFMVPILAFALGLSDSTELDFRSLGLAAVICVVALPVATVIFILRVPGGSAMPHQPISITPRYRLRETFDAVRGNSPLLRLLAAFLPVNVLAGLSSGLAYLYIDTYLGLSAQLPAIMATALLVTLAGIPFWTALSARYERHRVWAFALIVGGVASAAFALVQPGEYALAACFVLFPLITLVLAGSVIVYTMSADIVDYGKLHTGQDHSGLYGSMFAFLQKSLLGISAAAGIALIGTSGFDATAATQTALATLVIKLGFAIAPAVGLLAAAAIIWNYPLNRRLVTEVQEALAKRPKETDISKSEPRIESGHRVRPGPVQRIEKPEE